MTKTTLVENTLIDLLNTKETDTLLRLKYMTVNELDKALFSIALAGLNIYKDLFFSQDCRSQRTNITT